MRKTFKSYLIIGIVLAFVGAFFFVNQESVEARSEYKKEFAVKYPDLKVSCYTCHTKKNPKLPKIKKPRNEYGAALEKFVTPKLKVPAKINAALGKAAKEKSAGGITFGELIKQGKLPKTPKK